MTDSPRKVLPAYNESAKNVLPSCHAREVMISAVVSDRMRSMAVRSFPASSKKQEMSADDVVNSVTIIHIFMVTLLSVKTN